MPPRHRSHRRLRKIAPTESLLDNRLVLLALADVRLSTQVTDVLLARGLDVVPIVDDDALERYLYRSGPRGPALPRVVVWQVGLPSLAALDAVWRAQRAGCGCRILLVGEPVADMSPSSAGLPADVLVYAPPVEDAIVAEVMQLIDPELFPESDDAAERAS